MCARRSSLSGLSWGSSCTTMYAHIWSAYTATSRLRDLGTAIATATAAAAAAIVVTTGCSPSLRRASGSARPAATAPRATSRNGFPRRDEVGRRRDTRGQVMPDADIPSEIDLQGRKCAVTGAGGFIGQAVCTRLGSAGAEVAGLDVDRGCGSAGRGHRCFVRPLRHDRCGDSVRQALEGALARRPHRRSGERLGADRRLRARERRWDRERAGRRSRGGLRADRAHQLGRDMGIRAQHPSSTRTHRHGPAASPTSTPRENPIHSPSAAPAGARRSRSCAPATSTAPARRNGRCGRSKAIRSAPVRARREGRRHR